MNFIGNVVFKGFEIIYTLGSFIEKYYRKNTCVIIKRLILLYVDNQDNLCYFYSGFL